MVGHFLLKEIWKWKEVGFVWVGARDSYAAMNMYVLSYSKILKYFLSFNSHSDFNCNVA